MNSIDRLYAEIVRSDLVAFFQIAFHFLNLGKKFHGGWYLELLAAKLEDVRAGRCKRLIVNLPPRHLKSHAVSIAFIAWMLGHDAAKQIISITYGQDLSDNLAAQCRKLMGSEIFQALFRTRIARQRDMIADFSTTEGGYRLATSVGGSLTGRGGDLIVIDDPIKAGEAISDKIRQDLNEWWDDTLRSRLNSQEDGAIIVVMQRVHSDDLVAHIQAHETW